MSENKIPWYRNGFFDSLLKAFAGFVVGLLVWILTFGFPLSGKVSANTQELGSLKTTVTTNTQKIDIMTDKINTMVTKEDLRQAVLDIREYIKAVVPPNGGK